jgi:two-component system, OmpR family, response regulator
MNILVVEDDQSVREFVVNGLQKHGYQVDFAADGMVGKQKALENEYDVIVLDRMLPKIEGLKILKAMREAEISTPVIILSALGDIEQRVEGLKAGSDDYLTKPFALPELVARVEALTRRKVEEREVRELKVADLVVDLQSRQVYRSGKKIHLQQRELRLLEYLIRNEEQIITRTMLLEKVWDYHFDPQTNVIDVHISRLRQKVDKDFEPKLIHTVRGTGYVLSPNPQVDL